jgi:hypothetical protein
MSEIPQIAAWLSNDLGHRCSGGMIYYVGLTTCLLLCLSKTPGYGLFRDLPGVTVSWLCGEHEIMNPPVGVTMPPVGQKLKILPNYTSGVVNLSDEL